MGLSGIGFPELLLILLIVFLLFGSKKLSTLGKDLGGAIKDFRKSMKEDESGHQRPAEYLRLAGSPRQTRRCSGQRNRCFG